MVIGQWCQVVMTGSGTWEMIRIPTKKEDRYPSVYQQYHIIHYHEAHGHRLVMSPDLTRIITSVNINRSDNTGPAKTWLQTPPGQLCTAIDSVCTHPARHMAHCASTLRSDSSLSTCDMITPPIL